MGMNVFLGLRYAVWSDGENAADDAERAAQAANSILAEGIGPRTPD